MSHRIVRSALACNLSASAAVIGSATASWSLPVSSQASSPCGIALTHQQRHKVQRIKIANRKRVEMFVGTRFHLPTRLRTAAPDIAAEWDYERNPGHEYPEIIGIGHMAPVWWKCGQCGNAYRMSVEKRVVRGGGCDHCAAAAADGQLGQEDAPSDPRSSDAPTRKGDEGGKRMPVEDLLEGEMDPAMRVKRSTMLNVRTKY